jgi:hypothetical protein
MVVPNPLAPERFETHQPPELIPWLIQRFGKWPATAHLYHQVGSAEYEVTPESPEDVRALESLKGTFVVRILPAGSLQRLPLVGSAVKFLTSAVVMTSAIKLPEQRALENSASPNNELGRRSNKARLKERIPYIVGGLRSVPDLLSVPYTVYVDHIEQEIAYYCVGVGEHSVQTIRDGSTLIREIEGASAQVYLPGKAPTGGVENHEPDEDASVGDPIEDDVYTVYQLNAVNGQQIHAWNDFTFYGSAFPGNSGNSLAMAFFDNGDGTGRISVPYNSAADEVTDRVAVGDSLFLFWPMDHIPPGGVGTAPDLSTPVTEMLPVEVDSLTVTAIDEDLDVAYVHLTVDIPAAQQAQWALLQTYFEDLQDPLDLFPYEGASYEFAQVTCMRELYVGPFFIDFEHVGGNDFEVVCNFVAPGGLFADDGVTPRAMNVQMQVILTPTDESGNPNGTPESFTETLQGSAVSRGQRALTMRCQPSGFGSNTRCLVQARRLTNTPRRERQTDQVEEDFYNADLDTDPPVYAHFSGTVEDEIRWTHCYSMSKPPNISFGNVTTIHTRTVATSGATRVKERELNCFAYRRIQTWDGTSFGGALVANDASENILFTILKDDTIGNLEDANIDFEGIVAAFEAVRASVVSSTNLATRFAYTFDDPNLTLEETMQVVCHSAFCTPYRLGDTIKVRPEIATDDSALVLNHRNILSDSPMVIQHSLGRPSENDSVDVSYIPATTGLQQTVTVPLVGNSLRPRQVRVVGITTELQALWHGYRAYMRMLYQRQDVTLEATQEAEILGARVRALIADGTRSSTQAGEVVGFDESSTIRTSQRVVLQGGRAYTCYLQKSDGTVEEFPVLSAPSERELELDGTPEPITEPIEGVPTFYILAPDDDPSPRAYLITSRRATSNLTHSVEAVNYSHMYYIADGMSAWVDFVGGLVDLSPYRRSFVNSGASITGGQWQGVPGESFEDPGTDISTASYTSALFITATAAPTHSGLIQPGNNTSEEFAITVGNLLVAGHAGSYQVGVDYTDFLASEHMVAVSYDAVTDRMALSIDGALVDEATVAGSDLSGVIRYLEDFEGSCRWLARWHRALSERELMEIYLRNRVT